MNTVSIVGAMAAASGVCMSLSPLLQAKRIRALGDASEVSPGMFHTMRINAFIWLTYGVLTVNAVIIAPNVVALGTTTAVLLTIKRYRRAAGHGHASVATQPVAAEPHVVAVPPAAHGHVARMRSGAASVVRAGRRATAARR